MSPLELMIILLQVINKWNAPFLKAIWKVIALVCKIIVDFSRYGNFSRSVPCKAMHALLLYKIDLILKQIAKYLSCGLSTLSYSFFLGKNELAFSLSHFIIIITISQNKEWLPEESLDFFPQINNTRNHQSPL